MHTQQRRVCRAPRSPYPNDSFVPQAPYRSSPFFWAFRQLCEGASSPVLDSSFAEAVFKVRLTLRPSPLHRLDHNSYYLRAAPQITDSIPFKSIGQATQTITGSESALGGGTLTSRVVVEASVFEAFFGKSRSTMTTTAAIAGPLAPSAWTSASFAAGSSVLPGISLGGLSLDVIKTEVRDSTLAQAVPGLGFLDDFAFPTKQVFAAVTGLLGRGRISSSGSGPGREQGAAAAASSNTVEMRSLVFAGGGLRVTFAPDGVNFFVWSRINGGAAVNEASGGASFQGSFPGGNVDSEAASLTSFSAGDDGVGDFEVDTVNEAGYEDGCPSD